jgi:G3E family GTPase
MRVTLLSGFLGSGKTTLLRRLLRDQKKLRLAVIVNDMAELEVDGDLIRSGQHVSEENATLISIHAGSISGNQRSAFTSALESWQHRTDLDHLIIETSGSTHPWPLIEEITRHPAYHIDTFVTLIDAKAFIEDYAAGRRLLECLIHNEDTGTRTTENLLAEQIQFATTLILTKTDRIRTEDLPFLLKTLELLNPHAQVHAATYGQIPASKLLGTNQFHLDRARLLAHSWTHAPTPIDPGHPSDYDIGSTILCDPRPFHPQRLWDLFRTGLPQGLHRSKGFLWLASRDAQVLLWNQAAGSIDLELLAYWKAALLKDPLNKLVPSEIAKLTQQLQGTHPTFGDRLNELTLIGTLAAREPFFNQLQTCLCTPAEITHWQNNGTFPDPWPQTLRQV